MYGSVGSGIHIAVLSQHGRTEAITPVVIYIKDKTEHKKACVQISLTDLFEHKRFLNTA